MSNEYWLTTDRYKKGKKMILLIIFFSIVLMFVTWSGFNSTFFIIFLANIVSYFLVQKFPFIGIASLGGTILLLLFLTSVILQGHIAYQFKQQLLFGMSIPVIISCIGLRFLIKGVLAKRKLDEEEKSKYY